MFVGIDVTSKAEIVISNGEIIIENDQFTGKAGKGKFIENKNFDEDLL